MSHCSFARLMANPLSTDHTAGTLLDGKYRLEKEISEGGMGKVYRATHIYMHNTVAIKILHPNLASDRITVERFRREAFLAAQINHPNAVAVTDFGVAKDSQLAYLVMEFLEGVIHVVFDDARETMRTAQLEEACPPAFCFLRSFSCRSCDALK